MKSRGLKLLQGLVWAGGYASGEIQGFVYSDVVDALKRWHDSNVPVYIYSSGSVDAQKQLFGHSNYGDLLSVRSLYFMFILSYSLPVHQLISMYN